MAIYNNTAQNSIVTSAEFTPVSDGNFAFFTLKADATQEQKEAFKRMLTSKDVGQVVLSETMVDGKPMLVTHGDKSKEDLLKELEHHGDKLDLHVEKKKFNAWAVRGWLSNVGQVLQLASAKAGPKGMDVSTFSFAALNLAANMVNLVFGGEVKPDVNGERYVKGRINDKLLSYLASEDTNPAPFSLDEKHAPARKDIEDPKSAGQKFSGWMKDHSVVVGEIGLRFFGAMNMVFPFFAFITEKGKMVDGAKQLGKWERFIQTGKTKSWGKALLEESNWGMIPGKVEKLVDGKKVLENGKAVLVDGMVHRESANWRIGWLYLGGKTLALTSKVPDPYDTTPKSAIDVFREKWVFKIASLIEAGGALSIAQDRFVNKKIQPGKLGLSKYGTETRTPQKGGGVLVKNDFADHETSDYIGGVGGALFSLAFVIRWFAPFGTKRLDSEEVYAHVSDAMDKLTPDKMPQAMADSAATLAEYYKGKVSYGQVYTKMMTDMYRYHQKALPQFIDEQVQNNGHVLPQTAQGPEAIPAVAKDTAPVATTPETEAKFAAAHPQRPLGGRTVIPASHVEKIERQQDASPTLAV